MPLPPQSRHTGFGERLAPPGVSADLVDLAIRISADALQVPHTEMKREVRDPTEAGEARLLADWIAELERRRPN
jgi:hypothetical protein